MKLLVAIMCVLLAGSSASAQEPKPNLSDVLQRAEQLAPLEAVIVAHSGQVVAERSYRGHRTDRPTNIKSASKTVVSALIGIAIDKGIIAGVDQSVASVLADDVPAQPDPRLARVTVGNLLSMQAGLTPTSGPNYGRWVASPNWVRAALGQPFVDEPGGGMLYSTGSSHLLSAVLTKLSGRSSLANAQRWLAPYGVVIAAWERDPQGIYLGGNEMAMSPRSLLAFGEIYRNGGRAPDGTQVIPAGWIAQSWEPRTASRYTGDAYGYGWFTREIGGEQVHYAWGFGGQMLYIVPRLNLTVVMTSDATSSAAQSGHRDALHALLAEIIGAVRAGG